MICEKCGSKDLEKFWMNFPIAWGPEIGVIKSAPKLFYKCRECGHIQDSGETANDVA